VVDVVVAGGGPAGAAAAAAARAEGLEVELVSGSRGDRPVPGESLPPGIDAVLERIFGAGTLGNEQHRPSFGNRSAWGSPHLETADFVQNPFGHGWHIDRRMLEQSLLDRLRTQGVRVHSDARLSSQAWAGDRWRITLAGESHPEIHARALVDATGRAARIARSQGVRKRRLDRLVAAYWMLPAGSRTDTDATTLVEAAADGWWYTTPVPGARRVVAFLTDADLLPRRPARSVGDWQERVGRVAHVRDALEHGGCQLDGAPVIVDAGVAYLEQPAGEGWVAAGDAAVSFDPLSSQGILTAVEMGAGAGRAIAAILTSADQEPLIRWGAEYARLLDAHLRLRASYYAQERRWPTAPFWCRRQ
jgi:flavin-dependent dehydrogenase